MQYRGLHHVSRVHAVRQECFSGGLAQGGALVGAAAAGAWLGCRPVSLTAGAAAGAALGEAWHWKTWNFNAERDKFIAATQDAHDRYEEEIDLIHQEHVRKILATCRRPPRHGAGPVVGNEEDAQEEKEDGMEYDLLLQAS